MNLALPLAGLMVRDDGVVTLTAKTKLCVKLKSARSISFKCSLTGEPTRKFLPTAWPNFFEMTITMQFSNQSERLLAGFDSCLA